MDVCKPGIVPSTTLLFVNRRLSGADSNENPIYSKHRADTMRKYSIVWVKLLRYI